MDAQYRIEREKQRFVLNHIRSVEGESRITSDYLQDIRAQREKAKHTLIVFIKERGDSLTSLFRKLESLISTKIMKGECEERETPPQNICRNGLFASYFKCYVQMAEMEINSVLVEFTTVNGGNPACHFSKNGELLLGSVEEQAQTNQIGSLLIICSNQSYMKGSHALQNNAKYI